MLQELEEIHERAAQDGNDAARAETVGDEAVALAEAVNALRKLGSDESRKKLEEYQAFLSGSTTVRWRLGHSSKILNSFDPDWWVRAFTDLF